ncbi:MAG: SPFH domain-containing protein, partial [Spirochaetia bacterium]
MIFFVIAFAALFAFTALIQLVSKVKIVGGNELGIISGVLNGKGFSTISGGRIFIMPIIHRFSKIDLTPHTIEVMVDSAIAAGVVPLNVKATVSFAIASNETGRNRAVTRIMGLANAPDVLQTTASSIIEGHLRDAIASMTPEQVMQDKDTLVARMINVCKTDLENIGLEITTMNIADVDDHRLAGVVEPDLYIALLKRIQTANALTQARQAKATADASSAEAQEGRRADVEVRTLENTYENLVAQTRVKVAAENQKKAVGIEQARQSSLAQVAGLKAKIEAERQRIEMLRKKFEAEVITPAIAAKEKKVLQAQAESATLLGRSQAEIEQIRKTMEIVQQNSTQGAQAYIIDNFEKLIGPFAETLELFPVGWLSIITGAEGRHEPISAVNPHAIEVEKNRLIEGALGGAVAQLEEQKKEKPTRQEEPAPALKEPAPAAQEASKPVAKQAHAQTADF